MLSRMRALRTIVPGMLLWLAAPTLWGQQLRVVDDEQHLLLLLHPAQRIVSLAPGATAMLFAAGAGAQVVGTSAFSDEPVAARAIERIGDAQSFDLERILALRPDVVVAWAGGTPATLLSRLEAAGLIVYRHRLGRLRDIPASVRRLGVLAGTSLQAEAAALKLQQRIDALNLRYARAPLASVLIQVWDRPVYTVGNAEIMSDVVRSCGDRNVFDDLTESGPAVSVESVLARDPAIILVLAPDTRTAQEWQAHWMSFPSLRAVRTGAVLEWTDQRLSRLGPDIIDATEALCHALRHEAS